MIRPLSEAKAKKCWVFGVCFRNLLTFITIFLTVGLNNFGKKYQSLLDIFQAKMETNRFNLSFFFFAEEWAKRRPSLANLSIWTLVSYAKKFDTMKKQLVTTHN